MVLSIIQTSKTSALGQSENMTMCRVSMTLALNWIVGLTYIPMYVKLELD